MPLWGKTDTLESAPRYLTSTTPRSTGRTASAASPASTNVDNAFFVDTTEAAVETNRSKGIKTPGWNLVQDIGNGRLRVESLIPMRVSATDAGDVGVTNSTTTEDLTVPDTLLAITVQPANRSVVEPATAAFTVTATATPTTTLTYQWQKQESSESGTTWTNVGTNAASYTTGSTAVTAGAGATNGDKYRVLVSAPTKTSQVITSSVATLTVTAP
jgi:hypothetical protein